MPIDVSCSCGKQFRARDEQAGQTFRCPGCRVMVVVPDHDDPSLSTLMAEYDDDRRTFVSTDDEATVLPGSIWQKIVTGLVEMIPPGQLAAVFHAVGRFGLYCLAALAGLVPLLLIIIAVKTDSLRLGLFALAALVGISIVQYINDRLLKTLPRLITASESRVSSSVLFDSIALLFFLGGLYMLGKLGYDAIDQSRWSGLLDAVVVWMFLTACGLAAINPRSLGIAVDPSATAGDDILTIVSFPPKLLLAMTPLAFATAAVQCTIATLLIYYELLVGDLNNFGLGKLVSDQFLRLVVAGLLPLSTYIVAASLLFSITISSAILAVPGKLDEVRDTIESD